MRSRLRASALALAATVVSLPTAANAAPELPPDVSVQLPGGVEDMAVDDVHRRVYLVSDRDTTVTVLDFDGQVVGTVPTRGGRAADLELKPDGSALYVAGKDVPLIEVIDTATLAVTAVPLAEAHCVLSTEFTGGRLWFTYRVCGPMGGAGSFASFDPATMAVTESGLENMAGFLVAHPDRPERMVLFASGGRGIHLYDVSGGAPVETAMLAKTGCGPSGEAPDADRMLVACGSPPVLSVYKISELAPIATVRGNQVTGSLSLDGRHTATTVFRDSRVFISSVADDHAEQIAELGHSSDVDFQRNGTAFTRDGWLIALTRYNGVTTMTFHKSPFVGVTRITADLPRTFDPGKPVAISGTTAYVPTGAKLTLTRTDRAGAHDLGQITVTDGKFSANDTPGVTGPATYTLTYPGDDAHTASTWTRSTVIRPLPFDFNADGHPEVVSGTLGEDDGSIMDTGQVHVFPGTPTGVTATGSIAVDQNTPGVVGDNKPGDQFGASTASGDFNGDGYADLAIGVPGQDGPGGTDAGGVTVVYGSATGLNLASSQALTHANSGGARFGHALAVGDVNGDGADELAVGAPGQGAGEVAMAVGTTDRGLVEGRAYDQDSESVPGTNRTGDAFGWSVAFGDANDDGFDDLAIGAPQDTEDKGWSTGSVTVLYSDGSVFGPTAHRLSKETADIPGSAGPHDSKTGDGADEFGLKVAMGDLNGDNRADLAVSAPGTNVTDQNGKLQPDAGSVTVVYSIGLLDGSRAAEITQNTEGIVGLPYNNDFFGDNLATGDSNRDGITDLAIFSYGDEYVTVTAGAASGLALTSTAAWTQDSPGVPGSHEAGDKWGASLRFLAGPKPTLIVGAPGEDTQQGAFTVMYIGPNGLTGEGAQYFGEGSPGVPGEPENGDRFGTF